MHPAQALARLEVPDRVQVVARRPVQQRAALVTAGGAGVGEQAVELVHAGIDQQRVAPLQRDLRLGQPERVVDRDLRPVQGVAAARRRRRSGSRRAAHGPRRCISATRAPSTPILSTTRARAGSGPPSGRTSSSTATSPPSTSSRWPVRRRQHHRPGDQPHPQPGQRRRQHEPDRNREQLGRAEPPRHEVQQHPQCDGAAAARAQHGLAIYTGTGVRSTDSRITSPGSSPPLRASAARITRWASTSAATSLTSAGITYSRPRTAA